MDIYDNTNVLDEVESLLESVPETTKHGDFSKIEDKVSSPGKLGLSSTSGTSFTSCKAQHFKTIGEKRNEKFSSDTDKIGDKGGLNFIDSETCQNQSTKRVGWGNDGGIDDTLDTLHEMLFPDESDKILEDMRNKTNLMNFAQSVDDENKWLFEGFPISSCPSIFHTYSNISGTLAEGNTNIENKVAKTWSSNLPVDPRKKPFVCIECNRAFTDVFYLKLHLKRHKGEKDFLCDQCPYKSYSLDELQKHIQRMHVKTKNILCEYCGNFFAAMKNLKEHLKLVHLQDESFVCFQCSYVTYTELSLKKHVLRVHHCQRYLHLCPVCGLKIKGKQNLVNHVKTHIKHKSYSCDTCGKSFSLKKRLVVHMETVHRARQYSCGVCSKLFQSKFHLDRHMKIHFKCKPFSCPYCFYASNTHGNLNKHVRCIHDKKDFSIKKYKYPQSIDHLNTECIERGREITTNYLNDLSKQLGEDITIKSLQEQKLLEQMAREVELLKSKKISKNRQGADHSYSEKRWGQKITASKIDLERRLQAHYLRVQEALYCDKPDSSINKSDQMLSGGSKALLNV